MPVALISHPACRLHQMGAGHPEQPARIGAIADQLHGRRLYDFLVHHDAPRATVEQLARVHPREYIERISMKSPEEGLAFVDPDTAMCPDTLEAALRAAGANVLAVDLVMSGDVRRAFCNVRPPGHHAERDKAMGFCFFNNVAVGAAHAMQAHGLERVAILDFDVHLGNGTEDIFRNDHRVLLCSSYEYPLYPDMNPPSVPGHIVNCPLPAGAGSDEFRRAITEQWLPALEAFAPQMIFISAGFDAHAADPLADLRLTRADYGWITEQACAVSERHCKGRIVSTLEGGYDLSALATSAATHVETLLNA
ncbi:MAG: histone deacetylase family protein [Gammaproteobacteria bacterium]|nr:histone deacetylase family protein [Gammaproteobacteria bacterium]